MNDKMVISVLSGLITEKRLNRFEEILSLRTKYFAIGLEDIYYSQNASAVLRTCECFGVQDIHVIENYNSYNINPMVVKGSDKWLTIRRYNQSENNSNETVKSLKSEGYRIVATSLNKKSVELADFDVERGKFIILFGNEHQGVSKDMMKCADEYLKIPMCGFTQSLNLSVSAGIIISLLMQKIRNSNINWQLSPQEKESILAQWLKNSVKNSQMIINRFTEVGDN